MKNGLMLFLGLSIAMGTTTWAQEKAVVEMTAFEKKIVEELPEFHYAYFVSEGDAEMTGSSEFDHIEIERALTAEPYINQEGVLMVAAEDIGVFLGFGKTRKETYWDENRKRVDVVLENVVIWDEETKKITIEVPWHIASYCTPVFGTEMWIPYEEGDVVQPWEPIIKGYDGQVRKHKKYEIAMTVGTNVWSFDGKRYLSRVKCEWKDGRAYLPLKDIHQTMFPETSYHWDTGTRTLALVKGMWE